MTDEIEKMKSALNRAWRGEYDGPQLYDLARAALSHIGERRGISFEEMDDYMLYQMRSALYREGLQIQVDAIDAELACRAKKLAERDEWREALLRLDHGERHDVDKILAAIAPLRERDGNDFTNATDELKRIADEFRQRAEAAEAKLLVSYGDTNRLYNAVQTALNDFHCKGDQVPEAKLRAVEGAVRGETK